MSAHLDPMEAWEAAEYGPQWGSYMTSGDPGYIMYTAIPPERPEHRDTMVSYLRDHCEPRASVSVIDDEEYTDSEQIARMIAYLEALEFPAEDDENV